MENEQYYRIEQDNSRDKSSNQSTGVENKTQANNIEIILTCKLSSKSDIAVKYYLDPFGFKEFALSEAEGLPSSVLHNAYEDQEEAL